MQDGDPRKYLLPQPKNAHLALECNRERASEPAITKSAGCEWEILSLFWLFWLFWIAGAYLPRQILDCGKIRRVATERGGNRGPHASYKARLGIRGRTTKEQARGFYLQS
jgi:hypothetical protein